MIPFAGHLGIEVTAAEPEEVRGGMDWAPEKCTAAGVLHGGALMAFADTLGVSAHSSSSRRRGDDGDGRVADELVGNRPE